MLLRGNGDGDGDGDGEGVATGTTETPDEGADSSEPHAERAAMMTANPVFARHVNICF